MRLIDADALIVATNNFCDSYKVNWNDRKVISWINGAPTIDAVPVVRCKDCKHYSKEGCWCNRNSHFDDDVYSMNWNDFGEDDFCSYGERNAD